MDFSFSDLNFNSVKTLSGFVARAAFTVNRLSFFIEDIYMVPTIVDDTHSYPELALILLWSKRQKKASRLGRLI